MVVPLIDILEQLKSFRQLTKIKMPAIAAASGVKVHTLYMWQKGANKSGNIEDYYKLKLFLDKMEWIISENKITSNIRLPLNPKMSAIYQINDFTPTGTLIMSNGKAELVAGRIHAPLLGHIEGLIEVKGDSMAPTFPNGSFIGIKRMNDYRILNWGFHYYIIDINGYGRIRKVYQGDSDGCLLLHCDNTNHDLYPPIQMQWHQILAILDIPVRMIKS